MHIIRRVSTRADSAFLREAGVTRRRRRRGVDVVLPEDVEAGVFDLVLERGAAAAEAEEEAEEEEEAREEEEEEEEEEAYRCLILICCAGAGDRPGVDWRGVDRLARRCGGLRSGEVSFSAMFLNAAGRGPQSSLSTAIQAASRMRAMQASDLL
jgi:hypothetical protein